MDVERRWKIQYNFYAEFLRDPVVVHAEDQSDQNGFLQEA
jgi:hypothetical protein